MAKLSLSNFVQQAESGKFPHFILYAFLEWILIFLLFVDGFLAFVTSEFARFFGLRTPCLFCTRIDHVLVHRDRDFYFHDSLCESHKKEISSLAYCHNHKKISDINKLCDACLLSFAADEKAESDYDTYNSLVGILHKDMLEDDHDHDILCSQIDQLGEIESAGVRCSCCGEVLRTKMRMKRKTAAMNLNSNNNIKGRQYGSSLLFSRQQGPTPSPSPQASFLKRRSNGDLKIMSENETELPEYENGSSLHAVTSEKLREDVKAAMVPLLTEADDLNDEANKTPSFNRGNRFFGIPLTDSASNSPRLGIRISRKSPLEKTEFASELSMERNNVQTSTNDTDIDSILQGLKSQVRLDKKSLLALYMELDEERSASAVAANNAMAMITRLQAEKAAVQMEALQYQRMMEEQFEYDQEALQESNEMLIKREECIKALEAELQAYREKYGCLKEGNCDNDDQEPKTHSYYSYDSGRTEIRSHPLSFDEGEANGEFEHSFEESTENEEEEILGGTLTDYKEEKTNFLGRTKLDKKDNLCENGMHDETETRSP